jgi:hypothetical protein
MEDVGTDRDLSEVSGSPLLAFQSNQSIQSISPIPSLLSTADCRLKSKGKMCFVSTQLLYTIL